MEVDCVGQVNLENRAQDCEEDQYRQSCQSDPEANARSRSCAYAGYQPACYRSGDGRPQYWENGGEQYHPCYYQQDFRESYLNIRRHLLLATDAVAIRVEIVSVGWNNFELPVFNIVAI